MGLIGCTTRSKKMRAKHWAVGEAGLDYYHCKDASSRERQAAVFSKVIDLAESLKLPLIIHSRDAEQQALKMVKNLEKVIFHCSYGSLGTTKEAVDRGFYISLATQSLHFRLLPDFSENYFLLDHLLVETDSPFLSPRRGRNEPAFLLDSVRLIAKIRNMQPQEIAQKTSENTKRIIASFETS